MVIVTGGAGFIGSHLVQRLVVDGYRVRVIDNLSEGSLTNLADVRDTIDFFKEDLRNLERLKSLFHGANYILHQAALRSVKRSVDNPKATIENNIIGTLNVLLAARDQKVRRVIFASSSSVYGPQKARIFTEDLCPNPQSPYATSKLAGELLCRQFYDLYGLETITLRYFNVFGPRQDPMSEYALVIPLFITLLLDGKRPTIHWDGKQSRDFTYIDNVVDANLLAIKAKKTHGEVINVASENTVSINQLFAFIKKELRSNLSSLRAPKRAGDMPYSCGSTKKAFQTLGFKPNVSFEKGIKKTIEWFRKNQE